MPASSAICASLRLSGQLPDQRSGTSVTARPDEQFAPNKPILSLFKLYIAIRSCRDEAGASTVVSFGRSSANEASAWAGNFEWDPPIALQKRSGENCQRKPSCEKHGLMIR